MGQAQTKAAIAADEEWPLQNGNPFGIKNLTNEFSFLLRPTDHGVGVFAAHDIRKGTSLRLYDEPPGTSITKIVKAEEVPGEFIKYCIPCDDQAGMVFRPVDFGKMDMVWFLNHSSTPNAAHNGEYVYHALRDIKAGEEILIDYKTLD